MWTFENTETTRATPARLWSHYADPTRWPEWDHGTASVEVEGPMVAGTRGTLKPAKGPATRFTFTEVTPQLGFTDVSRLPLARLTFSHRIQPDDAGCRFTHRVTFDGPLAPLFARLIGRTIAGELPTAMRRLAELAESPDGADG